MIRLLAFSCALLCLSWSPSFADEDPERPVTSVETGSEQRSEAENDKISNVSGLSLSPDNQSVEGLEIEELPQGAIKADLQGRFRHALVLRIAPDGSRSIECIDSAEREAELLEVALIETSTRHDDSKED